MSSVQAVTETVVFEARVASFYPIDYADLSREFHEWMTNKQHDFHFVLYKTAINHEGDKHG